MSIETYNRAVRALKKAAEDKSLFKVSEMSIQDSITLLKKVTESMKVQIKVDALWEEPASSKSEEVFRNLVTLDVCDPDGDVSNILTMELFKYLEFKAEVLFKVGEKLMGEPASKFVN